MGRTVMTRWVLQRYTKITGRLTDRGQTSFEYLGIAVVIAVIIGVLATTDIGQAVKDAILNKITDIAGG
jgi:hypothetical protein